VELNSPGGLVVKLASVDHLSLDGLPVLGAVWSVENIYLKRKSRAATTRLFQKEEKRVTLIVTSIVYNRPSHFT
jgi:hypothetical protein